MGQSVTALMYGIKSTTRGLRTKDGELFFDDRNQPESKRLAYEEAPRDAYEGDVLGFAVAVSDGHEAGEGDLSKTCLVSEIEEAHKKHIASAKKRWDIFAAWALKEHGKTLPPAALWITRDERA